MAKKIIKAQMKQRSDTMANWAAQNPVLLAGELGIVSDDPNLYKVGNGILAWNALPFRGFDGNIVHTPGTSANAVMSQLAVTEAIEDLRETTNIFIEDLQNTKIDKENDDYYPSMSVGVADHLAGHDEPTPSEFTFRKSGGGAILSGNARVQSVKGNSVVWNQKSDGGYVDGERIILLNGGIPKGHIFCMQRTISNGACWYLPSENSYKYQLAEGESVGVFTNTLEVDATYVRLYCTAESGYVRLIDLTQMFGAGNEPQTIDDFYSRIPQGIDMNAYNEGEVIHMNVDAVKSVGFNQWDEVWEQGQISQSDGSNVASDYHIRSKNFIKVMPGKTYVMVGTFRVIFYDAEKEFVDWWSVGTIREFTLPDNVFYVRLYTEGATYNHDICINISDAEKDGIYEPYISRMQSLEILRKYFPNGMRSAGTAHDEIRYNKATQKWEAVKRIGEVDMGSLMWQLNSDGRFETSFSSARPSVSVTEVGGVLCRKYTAASALDTYNGINGISIDNASKIWVRDSAYTDVVSFRAAMQGVILYYELANPIVTEIEEAFNLDYEVWNGGTEQAIADTPTSAFKADIIYGFNAYGVIKELREQIATLQAAIAKMNV